MKYIAALTCLLLTSLTSTAFALQGNDCAARSEKVNPAERETFMASCLAQAESPANVKEVEQKHKSALCEQNAKNKNLQGGERANYQANCMNKNEAAVAAKEAPKNVIAIPGHKSTSGSAPKVAASQQKTAAVKQKEHKKAAKKNEKRPS